MTGVWGQADRRQIHPGWEPQNTEWDEKDALHLVTFGSPAHTGTAWCDGVEEVDGFVGNPVPATRQPPLPLLFPGNCLLFCWWHAIKRKARLGNDFYLLSLDTGKQLAIEVGTTTQSCRKRHPSSQQRQQQQLQRQHTQRHSTAIPLNDGRGVYQPCSPRHWGLWSSEMSISPINTPSEARHSFFSALVVWFGKEWRPSQNNGGSDIRRRGSFRTPRRVQDQPTHPLEGGGQLGHTLLGCQFLGKKIYTNNNIHIHVIIINIQLNNCN